MQKPHKIMRYVILALLLAVGGGCILAFQTKGWATAATKGMAPPFANQASEGVITVNPSNDDGGLRWLAVLVWSPVAAALAAFTFAIRIHRQSLVILGCAFLTCALAIVAMCLTLSTEAFLVVEVFLILVTLAAAGIDARRKSPRGGRSALRSARRLRGLKHLHLATAWVLLLSALLTSATTHWILRTYQGWGPSPDLTQEDFSKLAANAESGLTSLPLFDEMQSIPSINEEFGKATPFWANRAAAWIYVFSALLYLFIWVSLLSHQWRRRLAWVRSPSSIRGSPDRRLDARVKAVLPSEVRILFAVVFYVSVGGAFSILYYNEYLAAASKQNAMLLWADDMRRVEGDAKEQLKLYFQDKGSTEMLEAKRLNLSTHNPTLASKIDAIRARYWPMTIIVQERPRPVVADSGPTIAMVIDPQIAFHDLIYFSFVSFTTTGYGDIKPVSETLRFMTVLENIMEILFTAMFFVVAMDSGA